MQKNKILKVCLIITVAWLCVSCDRNTVYHHYETTSIDSWERSDTLFFRNIAIKASTQYKEEIGLRINDNFPFQNLFLVVEQDIRPLHQHRIDTLNCKLIDKYGTIKGRGLSYYQYNFHLTTLQLNAGDTLDVHIRHHMKREILPGIANIGIKLSKQ